MAVRLEGKECCLDPGGGEERAVSKPELEVTHDREGVRFLVANQDVDHLTLQFGAADPAEEGRRQAA